MDADAGRPSVRVGREPKPRSDLAPTAAAPKSRGALVAEHRLAAAAEHRGDPESASGQLRPTNRIHAPADPMQATPGQPVLDRLVAEVKPAQLGPA